MGDASKEKYYCPRHQDVQIILAMGPKSIEQFVCDHRKSDSDGGDFCDKEHYAECRVVWLRGDFDGNPSRKEVRRKLSRIPHYNPDLPSMGDVEKVASVDLYVVEVVWSGVMHDSPALGHVEKHEGHRDFVAAYLKNEDATTRREEVWADLNKRFGKASRDDPDMKRLFEQNHGVPEGMHSYEVIPEVKRCRVSFKDLKRALDGVLWKRIGRRGVRKVKIR